MPNGSSINDVTVVGGEEVYEFDLKIFVNLVPDYNKA